MVIAQLDCPLLMVIVMMYTYCCYCLYVLFAIFSDNSLVICYSNFINLCIYSLLLFYYVHFKNLFCTQDSCQSLDCLLLVFDVLISIKSYIYNLGTYQIIQKYIHWDTWYSVLSRWIKPWTKVSPLSRIPI